MSIKCNNVPPGVSDNNTCSPNGISIHKNWIWYFPDTEECFRVVFTPNASMTNPNTSRAACGFSVSGLVDSAQSVLGFFSQSGKLYIDSMMNFKFCAYQIGPIVNFSYPMRSQDGITNSFLVQV